eukprot:gene11958-5359_t
MRDFVTHKKKLGKKVTPMTQQDLSFKSQSVFLQTQNLRSDESIQGNFVTSRNLSLQDLVSQLKHYNPTHQKDAILGMKELIALHPVILNLKLGIIFDSTIPLMLDLDKTVRIPLKQLYEFLFPMLDEGLMKPFLNFFMACIGNGLTHSKLKIRLYCVSLLSLCLEHFPKISFAYSSKILPYLITINRMEDVKLGDVYTKLQMESLKCLNDYLTIIFAENKLNLNQESHAHFAINQSNEITWKNKHELNMVFTRMNEYEKQNTRIIEHLLENSVKSTIYDLDSFESILTFYELNLKNLVEIFIENATKLTKEKVEILDFNLQITYKMLYALEDVRLNGVKFHEKQYESLLKPFFGFYVKSLPFLQFKQSTPEMINSINTILISILSFSFQVDRSPMLLKWEEKFIKHFINILKDGNLTVDNVSYLLGIYKRIRSKISHEMEVEISMLFFNILIKKKSGDFQNLILNFFHLMMKNDNLEIPQEILKKFINENLRILLSNQKDMKLFTSIVGILTIVSKKYPKEIKSIQNLIIPFFWKDSSVGMFNNIPQQNQESFVRLLYNFTTYSSDLLKSIANSCCSKEKKIPEDVLTLLLELFRHQIQFMNSNLHISFCLSILCSNPLDSILNEVLLTLKRYGIEKSKLLVHSFLISFFKKNQQNQELIFVLLSLVHHFKGDIKDEIILNSIIPLMENIKQEKYQELCESLLMYDDVLNTILNLILKSNFLDAFIQICKFQKLKLSENEKFMNAYQTLKKKNHLIDSMKIQEMEFLMNKLN